MAHVTRRLFSTAASWHSSAAEACSEVLERFGQKPVSIRKQLFDANQVQLLSLTLGRPHLYQGLSVAYESPPDGTPIPPGYHLAYFTVPILEKHLGRDGSDRTVNPLQPFTRRMWAGGELEWDRDPQSFLKVGQVVQETTKLLSAEPKKLKSGAEMLVVGVEKTYETERGVALVDKRNWLFQKEIMEAQPPPPRLEERPLPNATHTRDFTQSEVTLFRFSALTFNGHKIHYSKEWCRDVEGHRDCVVHGPLNLINMLDFWRDTAKNAKEDTMPKSIAYRAMSPLYVGEQYRCVLEKSEEYDKDDGWRAEIWDGFGKQAMKGMIVG